MDFFEKAEKGAAGTVSAPLFDISFGHEAGGDFVLPDYLPEIQRLIGVTPTVLPETKFLSGNVLELGGSVTYNVLYVGDSGDVSATSFVSEYSADCVLPKNCENPQEIFCDCEIENTTCRVTGPRAVNIKSRLKSRAMCDEKISEGGDIVDFEGKGADASVCSTVEKLSETVKSLSRCHGIVTGNVSGELRVGEEFSPVVCEGALHAVNCKVEQDCVNVSGEVWITCLFSCDGEYKNSQMKIPFESCAHMREVPEDAVARAWGRVASVSLTRAETDESLFNVSCEYDLESEVCGKSEAVVCRDAYSTDFECETENREEEILKVIAFGTRQLTVNGKCDVKNMPEGSRVVFVSGNTSGVQVSCNDGKPTVSCNLKLKSITCADGEIAHGECEVPVKFEIPEKEDFKGCDFQSRATCAVLCAEGKCDGEKVNITAELSVGYEVLEKQKTRVTTEIRMKNSKPVAAVGSGVKVYYPQKEESLWSICKKYHANRAGVVKHNNVEGDTVPMGKPIIIM